jgi:hypothetical protein
MPKKVETMDGAFVKIKIADYRRLAAQAYEIGTINKEPPVFPYKFCLTEFYRGRQDDERLRAEIAAGYR